MLLHQGIFAMKRDGVKVQVKGDALFKAQSCDSLKPQAHQSGIALGIDAAMACAGMSVLVEFKALHRHFSLCVFVFPFT